jgi:multicomponent Na+:H+ antiporter subunit B
MIRIPVLRVVTKLLLPYILLFALYVQFHGDYGPGGGFQAGVIFAAGLILYSIVYGVDEARRVASPAAMITLAAIGVLIYAGVGVVTLIAGGNFLEYAALDRHDPAQAQHLGIMLIELGVGITVFSVLVTIFYAFAGRRRVE